MATILIPGIGVLTETGTRTELIPGIGTISEAAAPTSEIIIASPSVSKFDGNISAPFGIYTLTKADVEQAGQSFRGNGGYLAKARFLLQADAGQEGNVNVHLYAHTGTFGVDGKPTGTPLSSATPVPMTNIPLSPAPEQYIDFTFPTPYKLVNGTYYFIVIEYNESATSYSSWLNVETSDLVTDHEGTFAIGTPPTWINFNDSLIFEIFNSGLTLTGQDVKVNEYINVTSIPLTLTPQNVKVNENEYINVTSTPLTLTPQNVNVIEVGTPTIISITSGPLSLIKFPVLVYNRPRSRNIVMGQSRLIEYIEYLDNTRIISGNLIQPNETHLFLIDNNSQNIEIALASDISKPDWSLKFWFSEAPKEEFVTQDNAIEKIYFNRSKSITDGISISSRTGTKLYITNDVIYNGNILLETITRQKSQFLHIKNTSGSTSTYTIYTSF